MLPSGHASSEGIRALHAGFGAECAWALSVAARFAPSAVEATPGADYRTLTGAGHRRAVPRSFGLHAVQSLAEERLKARLIGPVACPSTYAEATEEVRSVVHARYGGEVGVRLRKVEDQTGSVHAVHGKKKREHDALSGPKFLVRSLWSEGLGVARQRDPEILHFQEQKIDRQE